jgi:hypothetical protein
MLPEIKSRKFAAFDLEIYKSVTNMNNWLAETPLGISCAAVAYDDKPALFWSQPRPCLDRHAARAMVKDLQDIAKDYALLSWNGAQFDFQVLAIESEMVSECAELALNHVDMMFLVYVNRGHFLGLDKALAGCGVGGKVHEVTLSTGENVTDMHGSKAPTLWRAAEYDAVLAYLEGDVSQPLALAHYIEQNGVMNFVGFSGNTSMKCELLTVEQAANYDDKGRWAKNRGQRMGFLRWIFE